MVRFESNLFNEAATLPPYSHQPRSWWKKFADAFAGVWLGARGQSSFAVHVVIAVLVIATAAGLQVSLVSWCVLILCIAVVMAAELFNSAIERLAKAVDANENEHIRDSLNIASGAVLLAAIGAAVVGAIVFINRLIELLSTG